MELGGALNTICTSRKLHPSNPSNPQTQNLLGVPLTCGKSS